MQGNFYVNFEFLESCNLYAKVGELLVEKKKRELLMAEYLVLY